MIRRFFPIVSLLSLMSAYSHEMTVLVQPETIYVGTATAIHANFKLDDSLAPEIRHVTLWADSVEITLIDGSGGLIPCTPRVHNPCTAKSFGPAKVEESGTFEVLLPFGYWCNTELPAGEYELIVRVSALSVLKKGISRAENIQLDEPVESRVQLQIEQGDVEQIAEQYQALLDAALNPLQPRTGSEARYVRALATHMIDLLSFTQSEMALNAQLSLLRGEIPGTTYCQVYDVVMDYLDRDDPKIAHGLVEVFEGMKMEKTSWDVAHARLYESLYLWVIHEMHARGDVRVVAVTDALVKAYPKPNAPEQDVPLTALGFL